MVKTRAIQVIDSGQGLDLWQEAGAKLLSQRKQALDKLRSQLNGPQPTRKPVRRPWRHTTDLQPGDILSFTATGGTMVLLRVASIDDHRLGAAPILERLDWTGRSLPAKWRLRRLKVRMKTMPGEGRPRPELYRPAKFRQKDPDWKDGPFKLELRNSGGEGSVKASAATYTTWSDLPTILELSLIATTP